MKKILAFTLFISLSSAFAQIKTLNTDTITTTQSSTSTSRTSDQSSAGDPSLNNVPTINSRSDKYNDPNSPKCITRAGVTLYSTDPAYAACVRTTK